MFKRGLLFLLLLILFVGFTSASYNSFSLENFADNVFDIFDASTIILGMLFILSFIPVKLTLGKYFKNDTWGGIGAFCVSFLLIYFINRSGFDFSSLFFSLGLSESLMFGILPFLFLIGFIIFIWNFGFSSFFLSFGGILLALTIFTDFVYEKGVALIISILLLLVGIKLRFGKKKPVLGNGSIQPNVSRGWIHNPQNKVEDRSFNGGWIHRGKPINLDIIQRKKMWQKRLDSLYDDNRKLAKKNNGRIPARGTLDGEKRAKNMRMIKVLENLIKSQ